MGFILFECTEVSEQLVCLNQAHVGPAKGEPQVLHGGAWRDPCPDYAVQQICVLYPKNKKASKVPTAVPLEHHQGQCDVSDWEECQKDFGRDR